MILPIVQYPHPILKRKCVDISVISSQTAITIENMLHTMKSIDYAIGLAAPQVGLQIRLFVMQHKKDDWSKVQTPMIFINPVILEETGEPVVENEGCLSIPGIFEPVERKPNIKVQYRDENFVEHIVEFSGRNARVIQHETDHLNGKLFLDYQPQTTLDRLKPQLKKIAKGKVKVDYPILIS